MAISIPIGYDYDPKGLQKAVRDIGKAEGGWGKAGAAAKALEGPALLAGAAMAAGGVAAVKSAEEAAAANAKLSKVFQSMGFEENTQAAMDYANALSASIGVDDEVIKSAQTKIATFSEVAKSSDTMARATGLAADLSAAGFGSMDSAAVMLGKALQDPVKGISSLSRVGVTLTKDQQAMVKQLVESGDAAAAQGIIMDAVAGQVGGVAEASARSSQKMGVAFGEIAETVGGLLLPAFDALAGKVTTASQWIAAHSGLVKILIGVFGGLVAIILAVNGAMRVYSAVTKAAETITDVLQSKVVKKIAAFVADKAAMLASRAATVAYTVATKAVSAATKVWAAIQWVMNAALAANPIMLVVLAIVALVAIIVVAYKKSETFRRIVDAAFRAVGKAANWMGDIISGAFSRVAGWIDAIMSKIRAMKDSIGGALSALNPFNKAAGAMSVAAVPTVAGRAVGSTAAATGSQSTITVNGVANPHIVARELAMMISGVPIRTGYRGVRA